MRINPLGQAPARYLMVGLLAVCMLSAASPPQDTRENFRRAIESALQKQRASTTRQVEAANENRILSSGAMQPSVEKQRGSVEKQLRLARPERPRFAVVAPAPVSFSLQSPLDPRCEQIPAPALQPHIDRIARDEGLRPDLLRVVIDRESNSWPCAVSPKGAMGLMQLMPGTAYDLGVKNPFDPHENMMGGARYLKYLLRRFGGDLPLALAAYNSGPATVDIHQDVPPIPETQHYVADIVGKLNAGRSPN